jgi:hypothetical protein
MRQSPRVFAATAALSIALFQAALATKVSADPIPVTVIDTLHGVSPSTVFDVSGSGGLVVSGNQFFGPAFSLSPSFRLTEIGAFANLCFANVGDPSCSGRSPMTVEIRRSINGAPDPGRVIASFALSSDDNARQVAFESASIGLTLPRGDYFALFRTATSSFGTLLTHAMSPFDFAPSVTRGALFNPTLQRSSLGEEAIGVRILGVIAPSAVPEPSTILLVATGIAAAARRRRCTRAAH